MQRLGPILLALAGLLVAVGPHIQDQIPAVVVPAKPDRHPILARLEPADAGRIASLYAAMSDVIRRDGQAADPVVTTTADLCKRHKDALSMAWRGTDLEGKYAGLGQQLDEYLLREVGDTNVPLDPPVRARAVRAFEELAR